MMDAVTVSSPDVSLVPFGGFGPRATPLNGEYPIATLFVGLGQVGWHAVSLIQNMLNISLPAKDLAHIQYMAIARRPAVIPEGRLSREHCLLLTLEETDWVHVPGRYSAAGVARWWPKPPRDMSLIPDHTAIRSYGRLLLFENPTLINDALQQRISHLIQHSNRPGGEGRRLVIIVTSIAEAEGGGLLFDVASLLRLQLVESPTTIVAMLTADTDPLPDAARTLAMANVYATLKELDAAMINPLHYPQGLPVNIKRATGKLAAAANQRPLDYLLITGDTSKSDDSVMPASALAELATTWVLSYVNSPGPDLPALPPVAAGTERFAGYTTFNVSKLGLPVAAATDLIGGNLAQQILANMLARRDDIPTEEWARTTLTGFKQALMFDTLFDEPKIQDRLHEMLRKTSPEALTGEFNRNKDKPDFSLRTIADGIIRRLDQEERALDMIDEGHTALRLETLRTRVEDALDSLQRKLLAQINNMPTQMACVQGRGLQWTTMALDQLSNRVNETLNAIREEAANTDALWNDARRRALTLARDHDERYSGVKRLLRGANAKDVQEIASVFEYTINCAAERIRWSSSVVAWQHTWEAVDAIREEVRGMLAQVERTSQTIVDYTGAARRAMDVAAQTPPRYPAGVLVDGDWFRLGVAQAVMPSVSSEQMIQRVYRQWAHNVPASERRVDRFVREVMAASRQYLFDKFQFDDIQRYVTDRANTPLVKDAISNLPRTAVPQWVPARETTGWTTHEWLRATPQTIRMFPAGGAWQRLDVPSSDCDEITVIRLVHGVTAEQIPALAGPYRRAYDRIAAESVPLHIDRRWDATLADLVRNTAQSEVSQLWEAALQVSARGPAAMREPLLNLIRLLAVALGVEPGAVQKVPGYAADFALTVYPLPTFRLRLPPGQCPIVFVFSGRRPRELGQDIYQAVTGLGLPEPFLFLINVNNRRDMEIVIEPLRNESYNVVALDEAQFKRVVGSRQPLSMLSEIVLTEVDLTLVSPFYTKAPVPEHMFYGREREIKDVRRKIKTHSVALIGGRRIGKTSTLHHIERLLHAPDSGYVPYYLDCHNAMQYSHFFNNIARRWGIKSPTPDPTCFEDIVSEIAARHIGLNIVFLFDEIDRLLLMDKDQSQSELLFRTFRSLSNEGKCHFIFSGERWLARAMADSYSALFNFALPLRLAPLEKPVVARLVAEPFEMMNIWLEDAVMLIDRIYEISAGHPNIVQMICQEMVVAVDADKGNVGLLNMQHLERAMEQHHLQEDIVHTIWGQMSDLARLITLLWPEDERHLTIDQVAAKIRDAGVQNVQIRDLQEALKDLELYCFVTPKGREFELVPVAFPALLDYMTVKQIEVQATVEDIVNKQQRGQR